MGDNWYIEMVREAYHHFDEEIQTHFEEEEEEEEEEGEQLQQ